MTIKLNQTSLETDNIRLWIGAGWGQRTKPEREQLWEQVLDILGDVFVAAQTRWPELDIFTDTIIPVMRDQLVFYPARKKPCFAYPSMQISSVLESVRIKLDRVGKFILGYNAEHNVLAVRCYPEGGWMIPTTVREI